MHELLPHLEILPAAQRRLWAELSAVPYFDDGDLRALPEDMKHRLAAVAREVDLEHLPSLEHAPPAPPLPVGRFGTDSKA